jgi:Predicted RNA methylase
MAEIHQAAAAGYTAKAEAYTRGRPEYPAAVMAWLRDDLALGAGKTVLDLGAGTGKFLPHLRATGAAVIRRRARCRDARAIARVQSRR